MAHMDQFVLGLERELTRDVSIGVTYIHRDNYNLMSRVNITGDWNPVSWTSPQNGQTYNVFQRINPGDNNFIITNPQAGTDYGQAFENIVPFTSTRNYRGLQFQFAKRYSNGWLLQMSYVLSKAHGSDDNSWGQNAENRSSMLGSCVMFSNPNYTINAVGPLSYNPTHLFKLIAAYDIPGIDVSVGISLNAFSGQSYNREIMLPYTIDLDPVAEGQDEPDIWIYSEPKSKYREPFQTVIDLRAEKSFQIGNIRLGAVLDVFNTLNQDKVMRFETHDDPRTPLRPFEFVRSIQVPRTFRLGLKVEF